MHPISSQDENWFPVFNWRGKPTFHKHLKRSFPSAIHTGEGLLFSASSEMELENICQVPAATREKLWDFPLTARWGPILMHCLQRNFVFPIKHVRSLDLVYGNPEGPQDHCPKSRRTLMSPQECKIAGCTPNLIKIKTDSPASSPEPSCVLHHTWQVAWLPLSNFRDSLRHPCQV